MFMAGGVDYCFVYANCVYLIHGFVIVELALFSMATVHARIDGDYFQGIPSGTVHAHIDIVASLLESKKMNYVGSDMHLSLLLMPF